jgi:phospholipase C
VPDMRNSPDINNDYGLMGFRIPTIAVSPWARRGHVAHTQYGFESILKFISYRFGLAPLNTRVKYANNIARSFDWTHKPRLALPELPRPEHVVSMPCMGNPDGATAMRAHEHDLLDLVTSGYLERLGFDYEPASPDSTFREPSKLLQALT